MRSHLCGQWFISTTRFGPFVHASLRAGEENSGHLVTLVRNQARMLAGRENLSLILSDGPPGIGCPVISSLSGVDLALLVTEPTASGLHDLERLLELCHHFLVPALVCVNKYDLDEAQTGEIMAFCTRQGVEVAGRLPFDEAVTKALSHGVPLVEYTTGATTGAVEALWRAVLRAFNGIRKGRLKGPGYGPS
ncbi:MAG: hypothetical protein D9V47_08765 [Clostridia bacterium]|nr:MAG: hypothetical protein D9V47_08765 [Clostridia bacterium]